MPESRAHADPYAPDGPPRLTTDEDDELRRLHWISRIGSLSMSKRERILELRIRDRRNGIRAPREFAEEQVVVADGKTRRWYHFRSR